MNRRSLFNHYWQFSKQDIEWTIEGIDKIEGQFKEVTLPHDWLIFDVNNLYEDSTGCYKKQFEIESLDERQYLLRFEGIYMDSTIYVNGTKLGEWKYGYSTFEIDMTSALLIGMNELVVQVVHQSPNSRWYSGAGIYRDVWLVERGLEYIVSDGIYVSVSREGEDWILDVETEVATTGDAQLVHNLYEGDQVVSSTSMTLSGSETDIERVHGLLKIIDPKMWSPDTPHLYTLATELVVENQVVEFVKQAVGFKDLVMDANDGFILNGKQIKLNGVCEHHDLGCLGAAFNKEAMRYRISKLKAMGVNAIRTAHNMPAPGLMDLADEMGVFIVSEAFDMWERSKTPYDYARFFEEWVEKDVKSWVRRDRNHVSLIMWSIGNEIYDTHINDRGQEVSRLLLDMVYEHDPKKNGVVTIGSNFMPWEKAQKCADIVKYAGYNYAEKYYDAHHDQYKDWIIYGSETSSVVQSRGIYHFPLEADILADDDMQCSSLGNSTTSWGARSIESCITTDRDLAYSLGQFLWTGFDYIGEPTPYHTRNSYFGQIDTAGFEKDSYYVYQAAWTDYKIAPMIHIFPYWDFNPGQIIDVRVCSNAPCMALFLNDELIEEVKINQKIDKKIIATWKIPYIKGELRAVAYDENHEIIAQTTRKSFGDAVALTAKVNKTVMSADGQDLVFIEVGAKDEQGNVVANANNLFTIQVTGAGRVLGVDNGDSTDLDPYKTTVKRLFSGKCLIVIGSVLEAGAVEVKIGSKDMEAISVTVESQRVDLWGEALECYDANRSYNRSSEVALNVVDELTNEGAKENFVPVRKIELAIKGDKVFTTQGQQIAVETILHPQNASKCDLSYKVVTDSGIDSNIGNVEVTESGCIVSAKGDGNFRVRCLLSNGKEHAELISELEFEASGLGVAYKDPYEFISGGLYDYSKGEVSNGNERGVATSRDGKTTVGYRDIDFGDLGSDKITLPIFALDNDSYNIEIWEGMPGEEGSQLLDEVNYQEISQWNVYQEATYNLSKRLNGITSLAFVTDKKIHIKGFNFEQLEKAYEKLSTTQCDELYGDQFVRQSWGIGEIGNNVTLIYKEMDFGEGPMGQNQANHITICGRSITEKNSIRIQVETDQQSSSQIVEFTHTKGFDTKTFELEPITGMGKVEFIFLPGSQFDFKWFKFS